MISALAIELSRMEKPWLNLAESTLALAGKGMLILQGVYAIWANTAERCLQLFVPFLPSVNQTLVAGLDSEPVKVWALEATAALILVRMIKVKGKTHCRQTSFQI